eukprot:sb/3461928/
MHGKSAFAGDGVATSRRRPDGIRLDGVRKKSAKIEKNCLRRSIDGIRRFFRTPSRRIPSGRRLDGVATPSIRRLPQMRICQNASWLPWDATVPLSSFDHQPGFSRIICRNLAGTPESTNDSPPFFTGPSPFHQSRSVNNALGLLSFKKRFGASGRQMEILDRAKNWPTELEQFDLLHNREIQKFGLVYIAKGQEKRDEILGNNIGSAEFEAFVGGLGWEMNWQDLQGFLPTIGKGTGDESSSTIHYATPTLELVFHVSTRLNPGAQEPSLFRFKYIDHIVSNCDPTTQAALKAVFGLFMSKIEDLESRLARSEQYQRRSTVVLTGLPVEEGEDSTNIVDRTCAFLSNASTVNVKREDVQALHRNGPINAPNNDSASGTGSKTPSITIRLHNFNQKDALLNMYQKRAKRGGASVYSLCETNTSMFDSFNAYCLPGYTAYHSPNVTNKVKGSGISIFVKNDVNFNLCNSFNRNGKSFQSYGGSIKLTNGQSVNVICVYRYHTCSDWDIWFEEIESLLTKACTTKTIITGDFNLNLFKLDNSSVIRRYFNIFNSFGLVPMISRATNHTHNASTLIDQTWSNIVSPENRSYLVPNLSVSTHVPTLCVFPDPYVVHDPGPITITSTNFSSSSLINFRKEYEITCIPLIHSIATGYNDIDIANAFSDYYNQLTLLYEKHFVKHKIITNQRNQNSKPWVSLSLARACRVKSVLYKKWVSARGTANESAAAAEYRSYRSVLRDLLVTARDNFFTSKFMKCNNDIKKCWAVINDIRGKGRKAVYPSCVIVENNTVTDAREIANSMNSYFSTVASNLNSHNVYSLCETNTSMFDSFNAYCLPGYTAYHSPNVTNKVKGSGISIFVKNDVNFNLCNSFNRNGKSFQSYGGSKY